MNSKLLIIFSALALLLISCGKEEDKGGSGGGKSRTDLVKFIDENFKSFCVKEYDTDNDNEISYDEAAAATELELDDLQITSLEGIEYFVNITRLTMFKSTIDKIDLSIFPKLTYLDARSSNLGRVDLYQCTALNTLIINKGQQVIAYDYHLGLNVYLNSKKIIQGILFDVGTPKIVSAEQTNTNWDNAIQWCKDLDDGWSIATISDLSLICENIEAINSVLLLENGQPRYAGTKGFAPKGYYWTDTANPSIPDAAIAFYFSAGQSVTNGKTANNYVRAVASLR